MTSLDYTKVEHVKAWLLSSSFAKALTVSFFIKRFFQSSTNFFFNSTDTKPRKSSRIYRKTSAKFSNQASMLHESLTYVGALMNYAVLWLLISDVSIEIINVSSKLHHYFLKELSRTHQWNVIGTTIFILDLSTAFLNRLRLLVATEILRSTLVADCLNEE